MLSILKIYQGVIKSLIYSDEIAPSTFFYLDTATSAVSQKYTTLQLDGNGQNIAPTDSTDCFLIRMTSSIGNQPSLLKSLTELSEKLASKISLAQRVWTLNNQSKFSYLVFPHTVQQYSNNSRINALYNRFLRR